MKIITISIFMIMIPSSAFQASPECPISYIYYGNYCYRLLLMAVNYLDAEALCAAEGGMIATILDQDTLRFLISNLLTSSDLESRFHIGLKMLSDMSISLSSCLSLENFRAWDFISPDKNFTTLKRCMTFTLENSTKWEAIDCKLEQAFPICMKTRNFPCPLGFTFYYNRCFQHFDDKISQIDAKKACVQRYSNLANFNDPDVQGFLGKFLNQLSFPPDRVHIGPSLLANTTMTYVDRTTITNWQSFPWDINEPNEVTGQIACTSLARDPLSRKYKLRNNDCTEKYSYICEIKVADVICAPYSININGSCYYITAAESQWSTAKLFCDLYGGQMAMLKNRSTHSLISGLLRTNFASRSVYFGFYYDSTIRKWKHVDGSIVSDYPDSYSCDSCTSAYLSNADCAIVLPTSPTSSVISKWKNVDCLAKYSGICIWNGCTPTASMYSKPHLQWSVNFTQHPYGNLEISCQPPFVLSLNEKIAEQKILFMCNPNSSQWIIPNTYLQCILPRVLPGLQQICKTNNKVVKVMTGII